MTPEGSIDDRLRREYFKLLPEMEHAKHYVEARVLNLLLPVRDRLRTYERVVTKTRLKDCESAINSLRKREEGGTFNRKQPERYTLRNLPDLVGIRIMAFPLSLIQRVNDIVCADFHDWRIDPIKKSDGRILFAHKYDGCPQNCSIRTEVQVMSLLTGLFSEVEHDALYKPNPKYKSKLVERGMQESLIHVLNALGQFENTFENLVLRVTIKSTMEKISEETIEKLK